MPDNYIHFDGTVVNGARSVDADALDIVGDIDLRAKITPTLRDPAANTVLIAKRQAGNGSYQFALSSGQGKPTLTWWDTNPTARSVAGTVGMEAIVAAGVSIWVRATLDVDNGSSSHDVNFYYSTDEQATWTQWGDADQEYGTSTTDILVTTHFLEIGGFNSQGSETYLGHFYHAQILNGIDGTLVFDADFTKLTAAELEAAAFIEDSSQAATVTLHGDSWTYVRPYGPAILGSAELLLMTADGNKGFSPKWADRSGNDHHAQLGSTVVVDTNNPLYKTHNQPDGQYLYLPGEVSNYGWTPDVNLLDADTANTYQSIGNWAKNAGNTPTIVADTDAFGDRAVSHTPSSSVTFLKTAATASANATLVAAQEYTFLARIKVDTLTGPISTVQVQIQWRDVNDVSVGIITSSAVNLVAGAYVDVHITGTSPANTTYARTMIISPQTFDGTQELRLGQASVHEDDATAMVPSLRVVGDLDMRVSLAITDNTPAAEEYILSTRSGNFGYMWSFKGASGDDWYARYGDGATNRGNTIAIGASDITAGQIHEMRVVFDISAGECLGYVDGVLKDTNTGLSTNAGDHNGQHLHIGSATGGAVFNMDGDVYWAEVRDGIDGPVVARFEPAEMVAPYATYTEPDQPRVWTVFRTGTALRSTIVDRDMLLFTTDDHCVVPSDDGLNFSGTDPFTLMILGKWSVTPTASDRLIDKRAGEGYALSFTSVNTSIFLDGVTTDTTNSGGDSGAVNTMQNIAMVRDVSGDTVALFLDGGGKASLADDSVGSFTNIADFYIGAKTGVANWFEGILVVVVAWRSALTDDQVAAASTLLAAEGYRGGLLLRSVGA